MDIGLLKVFKAVEEEGSVTKAALKLNCVQSNVTARVRQLEDELDVPLFYRKKRGMALTPSGQTLSDYADRILRLTREAEKAVREGEHARGSLCIGTLDSTAAARLPAILSGFRRECPKVELTIKAGSSRQFVTEALDYKLDGAFIGGISVDNPAIEKELMFDEELVAASEMGVESIESIENPTLVVFPQGCSYRKVLEDWCQAMGKTPYKTIELGTIEGILGCVMAGLGIAIFPRSVIKNLNYSGKVVIHKIPGKFASAPTLFIRRKDAVKTKALETFLKIARMSREAPDNHLLR